MKVTISSDQESIDPTATCSEKEFAQVKAALDVEYEAAILKEYPDAEVDCGGYDTTYAIRVTETGLEDPRALQEDIQRICEEVFETGMFWL